MSNKMNYNVLAIAIYNLLLLIGTTYLIVMLDWSVLWYVFTYFFLLELHHEE
jgi:hypothetical protein